MRVFEIYELSEYHRAGTIDAVASAFPYKLFMPSICEYLLGNTVSAVAFLLRVLLKMMLASEYHRVGTTDAVASAFPYKLFQPFMSEYLLGNTVIAVASWLHAESKKA